MQIEHSDPNKPEELDAAGMAELNTMFASAWPGEVPGDDMFLWNRLSAERKRQVIRRLNALLGRKPVGNHPPRFASVKAAAKAAKMAVPTFHAMDKRWRDAPSLSSLGVYAPAEGRGPTAEPSRGKLRERVRDLILAHPDYTAPQVHAALSDLGVAASFTTVLRLWREIRRSVVTTGVFGQHIIFDSAGLDLMDGSDRRLRLCAAIDAGSGFVLGWDLTPDQSVLLGYRFAARHAAFGKRPRQDEFLISATGGLHDLDLSGGVLGWSSVDSFELRFTPQDQGEAKRSIEELEHPKVAVVSNLRLGRLVIDTLGERIAGLWLGRGVRDHGRSYRTGRIVEMPIITPALWADVASHIKTHNDDRSRVIAAEGGIIVPGVLRHELEKGFRALIAAIRPMPDLAAEPSTAASK